MTFRAPTTADGPRIFEIVRDSGSLDLNSAYAYLLLTRDFAETSIVASVGERVEAFVMGYRLPRRPEILFVWQVGVSEHLRGQGIATHMLQELLERAGNTGVRFLETTVTPRNRPSQRLFEGLARDLGVPCRKGPGFAAEEFVTEHDDEERYRIGPFERTRESC